MPDRPIRILIVDDHAVVRKGLAMVLSLEPDFAVVGEASNGLEAIELVEQLEPDVILIDRAMPRLDGPSTVRALKKRAAQVRVLMLTGMEVDQEVVEILATGVDGYTLKEIEPDELKQAIRMVASGQSYLHPDITRLLLAHVREETNEPQKARSPLTPREYQVLQEMATAATYKNIGARLQIGEETVRTHAKNIMTKLGQPNRTMAVVEAMKMGLLDEV